MTSSALFMRGVLLIATIQSAIRTRKKKVFNVDEGDEVLYVPGSEEEVKKIFAQLKGSRESSKFFQIFKVYIFFFALVLTAT